MTQLTTLAKVKASLGITDASKDTLLTDFINEVSAFISSACGGRQFLAEERTEIEDAPEGENLFLKEYPISETEPLTLEYRTGTIGTPVWVAYTIDDFLIYFKEGYLKIISAFGGNKWQPTGRYQALRVTYTGGYLIDFANENDPALHNLPADITSVATQLVAQLYNDRMSAGIKSQSTEGQSITYESVSESDLNTYQKTIISRYMRYSI